MRFLALDFEAGSITNPGPVTLGLAIFQDGEVESSREWLYKPIRDYKGDLRFEYTPEAEKVHGKSLAMMDAEGLEPEQIYSEVKDFIGGEWQRPIISHVSAYDSNVWGNFSFSLGQYDRNRKMHIPAREIITGPWICTFRIAKSIPGFVPHEVPNLKLDTLTRHFGHEGQGEIHGAEADAILAGQLYLSLLAHRKVLAGAA